MIETTDAGTMITGEHIEKARVHTLLARLAIEISGMRMKGRSSMILAKEVCGSPKRTKAGVMEDLVFWMYGNDMPIEAQWGTVTRALGAERTGKLQRKILREYGGQK